jgi:hypothetical protein
MKRLRLITLGVALCLLTACSFTSLKDGLALILSAANATGAFENWRGTVLPSDPAPQPRAAFLESDLESIPAPDSLGLETVLVKLSTGVVYPVVCDAEQSTRCKQFVEGEPIFLNKGRIAACNVVRNGVLYGTCIYADQVRREM